MEKLKMHTPDLTQDHITRIRELFPNCVTEARDEGGKLKLAVDFDQLKQELSDSIVEGPQERYHLNWPGKREALLTANAPIAKTLRPVREESVDFDTTKNLFIEGDNLEALKLLQETYLGKVKMIYIDPPYNTSNDFIYKDDFASDVSSYLVKSNQKDEKGNRLIANPESNGRKHSDWLCMMYSRLKLARNLLSDSGVIFISIDDNEQANLKKLCDEIYGEKNFVACLPTVMNLKGNNDQFGFAGTHELTLVYIKDKFSLEDLNGLPLEESDVAEYSEEDGKGLYKQGATLMRTGEAGIREARPKGYYPIYVSADFKKMSLKRNASTDHEVYPRTTDGKDMSWRRSPQNLEETIDEFIIKKTSNGISFYKKQRLEDDKKYGKKPKTLFYKPAYSSGNGTAILKEIFGERFFDNPKPLSLISDFISIGLNKDDIALDFFAGSATTAHAIMKLNADDGGSRKFILVQLPEIIDGSSQAYKAGYKNIADLSKERIRRAGKIVAEGQCHENWNKDIGFRVLKIDTSNMAEVYYTPDGVKQDDLLAAVDNIRPNRSPEDLLFQVFLQYQSAELLTGTISKRIIQNKTVFFINDAPYDLVACFDAGITEELVKELAAEKPLRVVFRDNGFASDSVKINAEQIFKQMSPGTDMKSI